MDLLGHQWFYSLLDETLHIAASSPEQAEAAVLVICKRLIITLPSLPHHSCWVCNPCNPEVKGPSLMSLLFQILDLLECLTNLCLCHFPHRNGGGERINKFKWIYLVLISEKLIQAVVKKLCWLLKTSICEFLPPCLWCLLVVHGVGPSQVQPSRATTYFSLFVLTRMNCLPLTEDAVFSALTGLPWL